jgi:hypothetical protein
MKNLTTLLIASIFILSSINAQEVEIGNNFYFKSLLGAETSDEKLKLNKTDDLPDGAEIKSKALIKVVNIENDRIFFKYLAYDEGSTEEGIYNLNSNNSTRIFSLSKTDFENLTNTYYNYFRGFKYGAYTVPIRLRSSGDNFEFDANLSLGANILGRIGSRFNENLFVDLSFGVGLTKVNLNKENSILGTADTDFSEIDVLSPTAFTVSFGALFNLAKNVNIGAYWGWDTISSADNKAKWVFNKKPWLGFGLNVAFTGDADKSGADK